MKKLGNHNRHRQWTQHEKEEEPEVKAARRVFGESRKVGRSLRQKASRVANGEYPLRNLARPKAVLLLVLLGIGILFTADQIFKAGTGVSPLPVVDPSTYIWVSNAAGDFDTFRTTTDATGFILVPNSTHTAVSLSKNNVGDLSIASAKALAIAMAWTRFNGTCCNSGNLGYYLTTNGTLPTEASYDPTRDKSVTLLVNINVRTSPDVNYDLYIQKNVGESVVDADTGVCSSGGPAYLCQSNTISPATYQVSSYLYLNYTGTAGANQCSGGGNTGMGCSSLSTESTPSPPVASSYTKTGTIPWFEFQSKSYYLGVFALYGAPFNPKFLYNCGLSGTNACNSANTIFTFLPTAIVVTPSPTIDTGGFFGPVIRALVSIGVFILTSIATFLGYVADVFVTAMDAVGSFFGLGAIGTAIRDALTGTANFIVNVFAVTVGWAVTLASLFQNGIGFITGFFSGSNGFVAWLVSFFSTLPGIWTVIQQLWTSLSLAVLTMNQVLMLYYIIGEFQVYKNGWAGFRDWTEMGAMFTVKIVQVGYKLGKEMFQIILDVKRLLAQWI